MKTSISRLKEKRIFLSLKGEKTYNGELEISYNGSDSKNGYDHGDLPKPLSPSTSIALDIKVPWSKQPYLTDRRGPLGEGQSWNFTTRSSTDGELLILSLKLAPINSPKLKLLLLNNTSGKIVQVPAQREYSHRFASSLNKVDEFELLIGTEDYINKKLEAFLSVVRHTLLQQNYPNPFSNTTTIRYQVSDVTQAGLQRIELKIYDLKGQLVKTLIHKKQPQGRYILSWEGRSDQQIKLPVGTYIFQLLVENHRMERKLVLIR